MKRVFGLDLIRFFAIFSVISVHFFLNNGFYSFPVKGGRMFISINLRWLFFSGVPLFLLLTGYLNNKKKLNKKYYKGIFRVLLSYIFISILCVLFRIFYLKEDLDFIRHIITIFNFTADGYSWYIKMYIGLFFLIPFLNILYNNLKNKNEKHILIITLAGLVSLCPIFNYIPIKNYRLEIIPNYWTIIYPLLYYFIGCYIYEYKPKFNKIKCLIVLAVLILTESIITYYFNYKKFFDWSFFGGYESIITVIASTIIFMLLYDINCNKEIISKFVSSVSEVSLDMYLFSFIVDNIVYKKFNETPISFLKYYIPIVLVIFITTYILSIIKKKIFILPKLFKKKGLQKNVNPLSSKLF